MRLPDADTSRAVVLGMSSFRHPELPDLPGVRSGVAEVSAILTDAQGTGLPRQHCLPVVDEPSLPVIGEHLQTFSEAARDTFIVYYAGHGVIDPSGELYLALPDTHMDRLSWTAIPVARVKQVLSESPATNRVFILDCCFSGRAIETMSEMQSRIAVQTEVSGTYTLTSAPPNSPSLAPAQSLFTAFTGELIQILQAGVPGEPELLTLGTVYKALRSNLGARGLPLPQQRNTENAQLLALARNRASTRRDRRPDYLRTYGSVWRNAHDGDANAIYRLSVLLQHDGFTADGEAWLQEAARLRQGDAMVDLARSKEAGGYLDEAELWFRRGADSGDRYACAEAAAFLERIGQVDAAIGMLRRSAESGDTAVVGRLVTLLRHQGRQDEADRGARTARRPATRGGTVELRAGVNPRTPPQELMRTARTASPAEATAIADALETQGRVDEAIFYYRRAADADNLDAMHRLGMLLEELKRYDEAENWYRAAAERGHDESMVALGLILRRRGSAVSEEWLSRSARKGNSEGMYYYGVVRNEAGRGDDAAHWFSRAAERGHVAAMNAHGVLLMGTDDRNAFYWLKRAAGLGNTSAMNNLGLLLVDRDPQAAQEWFTKAADRGNLPAVENLERLRRLPR